MYWVPSLFKDIVSTTDVTWCGIIWQNMLDKKAEEEAVAYSEVLPQNLFEKTEKTRGNSQSLEPKRVPYPRSKDSECIYIS
jgi:hypothetical protein